MSNVLASLFKRAKTSDSIGSKDDGQLSCSSFNTFAAEKWVLKGRFHFQIDAVLITFVDDPDGNH